MAIVRKKTEEGNGKRQWCRKMKREQQP